MTDHPVLCHDGIERETKTVHLRHGLSATYIYETTEERVARLLGAEVVDTPDSHSPTT